MSEIIEFAHAVSDAAGEECARKISGPTVLRGDAVLPSLSPEETLKNAHERSENFFLARGKELTAEE